MKALNQMDAGELAVRRCELRSEMGRMAEDLRNAPSEEKLERSRRLRDDYAAILDEENSRTRGNPAGYSVGSARVDDSEARRFFLPKSDVDTLTIGPEYRLDNNITIADSNAKAVNTVPSQVMNACQMAMVEGNPVYDLVDTLSTATGADLDYPTITTDATAAMTAEAVAATQTTPVFSSVEFLSFRFDAYMVASHELLRDTAVPMPAIIGQQIGRGIAKATFEQFVNGDGTTEPQGLVTGSSVGITTDAAGVVTVSDLKRAMLNVPQPYRGKGFAFALSSDAYADLALAVDDNGQPMLGNSISAAIPGTLFGFPLVCWSVLPGIGAGNKTALVGNFAQCALIRHAGGMDMARDDSVMFKEYCSLFRGALWCDSRVLDAVGLQHVVCHA